ncbi:MAG TPA: alpha-amylase family glycosyl hydrolase, partial [Clostridia bacterium]|nr:alpha-amylase family glycosyl hydrolase [Clostridia bacterium]
MRKTVLCLVLALTLLCSVPAAAQPQEAYNWYEVFVYSFKDSDGDGIGDLPGLTQKLDYIRSLGFTALWLMPVMPSPSYHKYDVTDYYGIDPQYGTLEDARALVAACRERGMRLIIDLPLNHSSTQHPWFLEAAQALRDGRTEHPRVDWYHFTQEPEKNYVRLPGTDWYYEEQFQGGGMPDLNVDNASLRAEIVSILDFWLNDVGVDGFRLDAVTSFYTGDDDSNIAFLRFLKETCEALKPVSFLVGECWAGLPTIARYYESGIDSFFLFPASQAEGY